MGDEIGLHADQVPSLGFVGDPVPVCPSQVTDALALGLIPVVAPLAQGPLNVNADEAAAALAVGLDAGRIHSRPTYWAFLLGGRVVQVIGAEEATPCSRSGRSRAASCRSSGPR